MLTSARLTNCQDWDHHNPVILLRRKTSTAAAEVVVDRQKAEGVLADIDRRAVTRWNMECLAAVMKGKDLRKGPCWDDGVTEAGPSIELAGRANVDDSTLCVR